MSLENDMTAKVLGKILAEGMNLADCHLEDEINSVAIDKLREINNIVISDVDSEKKIQRVKEILNE